MGKGKVIMNESYGLEQLKIEIENKREKLNKLIIGDINKDEVLEFSTDLDNLIHRYYDIEMKKIEE